MRHLPARAVALVILSSGLVLGTPKTSPQREVKGDSGAKADWSVFLPDGEGKSDVAISCSSCHDLRQVIIQKKSRANWAGTVQKMVSAYQAPLDKDDFPALIGYLSKNFGEDNPVDQLPINLNKASAAVLSRIPGIDSELAGLIVESRKAKGDFASVDDLMRVKGIGAEKLGKIRGYVTAGE